MPLLRCCRLGRRVRNRLAKWQVGASSRTERRRWEKNSRRRDAYCLFVFFRSFYECVTRKWTQALFHGMCTCHYIPRWNNRTSTPSKENLSKTCFLGLGFKFTSLLNFITCFCSFCEEVSFRFSLWNNPLMRLVHHARQDYTIPRWNECNCPME